jgi:hypothetical protein
MTGLWESDGQRARGLAALVAAIVGVIVLCNVLVSPTPVSSSVPTSSGLLFGQTASQGRQHPPYELKSSPPELRRSAANWCKRWTLVEQSLRRNS